MINHFIEAFSLTVKNYAHKPALFFGQEQYSYEEIDQLSDTLASVIVQQGLPQETIIPLVLERTPNIIIAMIGVLKAGCSFLPISPASPCSRIEYILEETKAKLLFCDSPIQFKLPQKLQLMDPNELLKKQASCVKSDYNGHALAYVMYTSGSTGQPKGVLIEHHSMMNLFFSLIETLALSENELFLALTDYTFDISLIELLMPLTLGASIVLTEHGVVADGKKIKHYLQQFKISFIQATPLTWEILLKNGWTNEGNARLLVGGEQFKTSLAQKLHYDRGNVWNVYGPTETSMWSMIYHLGSPPTTESVPLGETLANTIIKLVYHDESKQAELYIGGKGLARGYLNAPELSATKFIEEEIRFYKTGDLVVQTEQGLLCYVGRVDNQLKFGGIRIEAGEIEATIENEVFVKKAVVKIHEHNDYYKTLAAYVEMDEEALFAHGTQIISEDSSSYIETIYDEVYTHAKEFEHEDINTCGWQNSFTGTTFQAEELAESYTTIQQYIQNSNLSDVLEVGCGTGSLLLSYLPQAQRVTLVEVSNNAIDYVRSIIPQEQRNKVSFKLDSLINIHETNEFSCIIVNSVIQYMPSVKSIIDSLKQLIKATKPGGTLLIGDVRSLELLDVFLSMKHFYHHPDTTEICPSHLLYKSRDTEIVLSPLFFYALKEQFKRISWVDINVKHGAHLNELNYFRYDVVLHIEKEVHEMECYNIGFNELPNEQDLFTRTPQPIKIINVPYDYLNRLCSTLSLEHCPPLQHVLRNSTMHLNDETKRRSFSLIQHSFPGYETFVHYQPNAPLNYVQLLLVPSSNSSTLIRPIEKEKIDSFHPHCREPFSPWLQKFCFDHIKLNVKKHVMTWVNPSIYIWVEKWPQTTNGKLDKKKLTLPRYFEVQQETGSILSQLKQLWLTITGNQALITEDFWTHGVSSLSMYYFLATINETFHLHMTYHEFHQYNTMEKLAGHVEALLSSSFSNKKDNQ